MTLFVLLEVSGSGCPQKYCTDIQMTDSSLSLKLEAPDQEFREGSDTVLKLTTCRTRITG